MQDVVLAMPAKEPAYGYELRDAQRAALDRSVDPVAALLLEGVVLRLRADLEWLEACERTWTEHDRPERKAGGS